MSAMKKIAFVFILLAMVCLIPVSKSYSYFILTHEKDRSLPRGEWELDQYEDPFTDATIYSVCKNSDDRYKAVNHVGSLTMLCVGYRTRINVVVRVLSDSYKKEIPLLVRFGKETPIKILGRFESNGDAYSIRVDDEPLFFDKLQKVNRVVIRYEDPKNSALNFTVVFDNNPEIFKKIAAPILKKAK